MSFNDLFAFIMLFMQWRSQMRALRPGEATELIAPPNTYVHIEGVGVNILQISVQRPQETKK